MVKDDDFKPLRGFDDGQTNGRTTFVNVESLSRLKTVLHCFLYYVSTKIEV